MDAHSASYSSYEGGDLLDNSRILAPQTEYTDSVEVHLLGGAFVTMPVAESTTFDELRCDVAVRMGLSADAAAAFDIFPVVAGYERRPRSYLEGRLSAGEDHGPAARVPPVAASLNRSELSGAVPAQPEAATRVLATMREFKVLEERYVTNKAHEHAVPHSFLVFKKWDFSPATETSLETDPVALRLVYQQAVYGVIHEWPVSDDVKFFIDLAALQMVVAFGPCPPARHAAGFLTSDGGLLAQYLPEPLVAGATLFRLRELEARILDGYHGLQLETTEAAMAAYLAHARKLRMYGATTFVPAKARTSLKTSIHGRIAVAISDSRLGFIEAKTRRLVGCYHFSHVLQWGGEHSHTSWTCSILSSKVHSMLSSGSHKLDNRGAHLVRSNSGELQPIAAGESTVYKFVTPQGHYISSALHKAVRQHMADKAAGRVRRAHHRSTAGDAEPSASPPQIKSPVLKPASSDRRPSRADASSSAAAAAPVPAPTPANDEPELPLSPTSGLPGVEAEDAFSDWDYYDDYDLEPARV
ncbi:uncharacterized protein AMSG_06438 [Thecamonas trahens ATCC 50062]|uniref:FERM central domain-containing protein n=1 Tax=Thecamonas trahens ATCC 50062 TaxID=461836 RepID=A0A0L0DD72_THETB|nr:hypothetical protein AMSG_06438 [Thecamonas trahens ATCC 50062]KNC50279.1 hypothetical protein AMSG_06438 [Thecamonas trahens ATCC 50062]|eukprot:XP_013757106.1 hypothetical protein AMSG_06438 [Thecamonas trahens ATCC 50062]